MTREPIANKARLRRRPVRLLPTVRVSGIEVAGLFGKLDYPRVALDGVDSSKSRVAVIYGDNGTGKTTILRLIYACLSPQSKQGLRTLIATTPFYEFSVFLSDGTHIKLSKKNLIGSYSVYIGNDKASEHFYIETGPDGAVREQDSVSKLEMAIRRLDFDVLFVDHNRVVKSTYAFLSDLMNSSNEFTFDFDVEQHQHTSYEKISQSRRRNRETDLSFPLTQVIDALEGWFRGQAYRQGAAGDQSAAAVYLEIAKSLNRDRRKSENASTDEILDVVNTLISLKETTNSFINHGLLSEYPFDEFINIYETASRPKKIQIKSVLTPFLDSIQRRISALADIHRLITIFEGEINKYFREKKVSFHILHGLIITDQNGPVNPELLSSGERQLIFLLCAAAISRSKRSLILIDEPELSLNYKWQRLIAGSLANISSGSETQYILASHSIEIITRYVDSSFELGA